MQHNTPHHTREHVLPTLVGRTLITAGADTCSLEDDTGLR